MIFTFAHIFNELEGEAIVKGSCDRDYILKRVNEAIMLLLDRGDWKLSVRKLRFCPSNNCIALPPFAEKVIAVNTDKRAVRAFNRIYEFLECGPQELQNVSNTWCKDLVDLGMFPTFHDIPYTGPYSLALFSTEPEDTNETVEIRGRVTYNVPAVTATGTPGEEIAINRWKGGIEGALPTPQMIVKSTNVFSSIEQVVKPVTKGYITLYAYDPDENNYWMLAKYGPQETNPGYRRYKILNHDLTNGECVTVLVKLCYVPLVNDNDMLLVQSIPAIKSVIMALNYYEDGEVESADSMESRAFVILKRQLANYEQFGNMLQVQDEGFSLGTVDNIV